MDRGYREENGRDLRDDWGGGGGGRKRPAGGDGPHGAPPHKRHDNRRGPPPPPHGHPDDHGPPRGPPRGPMRRAPPPPGPAHPHGGPRGGGRRSGGGGPGQHVPLHLNHFDRRAVSPPRGGPRGPHGGGPRGGRGSFGGPGGGEVMMSYKEFLHQMPDDVTPEDAQAAYAAYREDLERRDTARYFAEHKNDPDFKAKYDPDSTPAPLQAFYKTVQSSAVNWMASAMGSLDAVVPTYKATAAMVASLKADAEGVAPKAPAPLASEEGAQAEGENKKDAEEGESDEAGEAGDKDGAGKKEGDDDTDKARGDGSEDPKVDSNAADDEAAKVYPLPMFHEREHKLFIRGVKPACTERHILDVCSRMPGLKGVQLQDGGKSSGGRFGWIEWDSERSMLNALRVLQGWQMPDFIFHLSVHVDRSPGPPSGPRTLLAPLIASTSERMTSDLEAVRKLIEALDQERGVTWWEEQEPEQPAANGASSSSDDPAANGDAPHEGTEGAAANVGDGAATEEGDPASTAAAAATSEPPAPSRVQVGNPILTGALWEDAEVSEETRLNTGIAYLRVVHMFDYYCGIEGVSDLDLLERASRIVLRQPLSEENSMEGLTEKERVRGEEWARELDAKVTSRTGPGAPTLKEQRVEEAVKIWCDRSTVAGANDTFGCNLCTKKFRGPEFVHRHLMRVHVEELEAEKARAVESVYYENFVSDPSHFAVMSGKLPHPNHNPSGSVHSRVGRGPNSGGGGGGGRRNRGGGGGGGGGGRWGGNRGGAPAPAPPPAGRARLSQYVDLDAPDTDMDDFFKKDY